MFIRVPAVSPNTHGRHTFFMYGTFIASTDNPDDPNRPRRLHCEPRKAI